MVSTSAWLLFIVLLVLANGLLSLAEMSIVSSRKARLQGLIKKGNEGAKVALELSNSPNQFLSTIQAGVTGVGILSGAFGGATIAQNLSDILALIPPIKPYADAIGMGVVVVLITYFTLILGELVPKRLALADPERIGSALAPGMKRLSHLASPIVKFLTMSTDFVFGLLPIKIQKEPAVTEQELEVMIDEGKQVGILQTMEYKMLSGIFDLNDKKVSAVMTPMTKIIWLKASDIPKLIIEDVIAHPHSRFPVGETSLENVIGIVNSKELLVRWTIDKTFDLKQLMVQPLIIPSSQSVMDVLKSFKKAGTDVALVMDEYGALEGLVTITDVVRAIMGETHVGDEKPRWQIVDRNDGTCLVDGLTPTDEFMRFFKVAEIASEKADFETLAGLIVHQLDHIPQVAEKLTWNGLSLEVVDMDGYRIDKVMVCKSTEQT